MKNKKLELLAPAGNLDKMKVSFVYGADAVYLGIPDFSLRVRINDFTLGKIKQAVKLAHSENKKGYVTTNIFAHNRHLDKLPKYIQKLKEYKIDGLIAADPGVIAIIKKIWPKAEIHLSTQANCTNWQSAKFWYEQGISRVVLGREVTLKEIKEINKKVPKLELEYFVHGAMCMAYSGRCFLSKQFVNRSGNLGDCAQPCRWKYYISEEKRENEPFEVVEEEYGSYILNSKDLNLLKHLDKLIDAGVTSFKIEGRAKSIYYMANVVGAYREALDKNKNKKLINLLYKELGSKLYHRGYTEGFLFGNGKHEQNIENTHFKPEWEFCGQIIRVKSYKVSKVKSYLNYIKVHNTLRTGDVIEILRPNYDIIKMKLNKMIDAKTGEELAEAHGGGGGQVVILEIKEEVPILSVIRRKIAL